MVRIEGDDGRSSRPPHDVYIEAFLGGGAILKRKPPALRSIDLNRRAIDTFRRRKVG